MSGVEPGSGSGLIGGTTSGSDPGEGSGSGLGAGLGRGIGVDAEVFIKLNTGSRRWERTLFGCTDGSG
jgi:hypothetical protein